MRHFKTFLLALTLAFAGNSLSANDLNPSHRITPPTHYTVDQTDISKCWEVCVFPNPFSGGCGHKVKLCTEWQPEKWFKEAEAVIKAKIEPFLKKTWDSLYKEVLKTAMPEWLKKQIGEIAMVLIGPILDGLGAEEIKIELSILLGVINNYNDEFLHRYMADYKDAKMQDILAAWKKDFIDKYNEGIYSGKKYKIETFKKVVDQVLEDSKTCLKDAIGDWDAVIDCKTEAQIGIVRALGEVQKENYLLSETKGDYEKTMKNANISNFRIRIEALADRTQVKDLRGLFDSTLNNYMDCSEKAQNDWNLEVQCYVEMEKDRTLKTGEIEKSLNPIFN